MRDKKAYYKEWYAKNRERLIAKARAYELMHPEKTKEKKRVWAIKNNEKVKASRKRYVCSEKGAARLVLYRISEKYKAIEKRLRDHYRDTLNDVYVRRIMAQRLSIKGSELPQNLVDAHRELMILKMELRNGAR